MTENVTPRAEDVVSVGTRISWGAILAGGMVALAFQFLFAVLGGAVGISISDRAEPGTIRTGALIWTVVVACASVFVGGMVTSQFTVGENKLEAVLYGIIMWAFLVALTLGFVATGARIMTNLLTGLSIRAHVTEETWAASARAAGVPEDQISAWRQKLAETREPRTDPEQARGSISSETATRVAWFVFGGTWLSMFAAAAGAWLGAGPTFRLVSIGASTRMMSS